MSAQKDEYNELYVVTDEDVADEYLTFGDEPTKWTPTQKGIVVRKLMERGMTRMDVQRKTGWAKTERYYRRPQS